MLADGRCVRHDDTRRGKGVSASEREIIMSYEQILIIAAVIVVAVGLFVAIYYSDKRNKFDERQLLVRAKAYRLGFGALIISDLVVMFLNSLEGWNKDVDSSFSIVLALAVSFTVFSLYCITHDAFFQRKDNPKEYLIFCIIVCVCEGYVVISHLIENGTLRENGRFTMTPGGSLLLAIMFLIVMIAIIIKMLINKAEAAEEEEEE